MRRLTKIRPRQDTRRIGGLETGLWPQARPDSDTRRIGGLESGLL